MNADSFNSVPPTPTVVIFKPSLWQRIADRNPFFLVSAVCMLWGCLSLTNSSSWNSLPMPRLLLLIGTLNIYEAALIVLALMLLKRGLLRDGKILLILEAAFLVDVAFLNAEVVTANLHVGVAVNAALFGAAVVKLLAIGRALRPTLSPERMMFVLVQMAVLLALPCYFRHADHGSLPPALFYAAWWIVGAMPAVAIALEQFRRGEHGRATEPLDLSSLFVILPWVSMIVHLGILHYAYSVEYSVAMATPVLLGAAIGLTRIPATPFLRLHENRILQVVLPVLAVCLSIQAPAALTLYLFGKSSLPVTPLALASAGAYLTIVYCCLARLATMFVIFGGAIAVATVFGPTMAQIRSAAARGWNSIVDATDWLVPKTAMQWGVVSVVASFLFLVLGAMISFKRTPIISDNSPPLPPISA